VSAGRGWTLNNALSGERLKRTMHEGCPPHRIEEKIIEIEQNPPPVSPSGELLSPAGGGHFISLKI